jgi:hypothetical protein
VPVGWYSLRHDSSFYVGPLTAIAKAQ